MRVFLDERRIQQMFHSVATINNNRQMDQVEEHFRSCGVIPMQAGRQGVIGWLDCSLRVGMREQIFSVLQDDLVAAVTVDAADVVPLMGSNFDAFIVQKALSQGNEFAVQQLSRISAGEIMDRLQAVSYTFQQATAEPEGEDATWVREQQDASAEDDLVRAGLITRRERSLLDPAPQPESTTDYSRYEESLDSEPSFDIFRNGRPGIDY